MATITNPQKGHTCQYFSLLYLMQEANAGALSPTDFKDCIQYMVNRTGNASGFISAYLGKPYKTGTTSYITSIHDLPPGQKHYVDNGKHAVVITKIAANTFEVWNPQLAKVATITTSLSLVTNKQTYPDSGKSAVDIWSLKDSAVNKTDQITAVERDRQIDIINALSSYLTNFTTTTGKQANVNTPAQLMNDDEKGAFAIALRMIDSKLNLNALKTALHI